MTTMPTPPPPAPAPECAGEGCSDTCPACLTAEIRDVESVLRYITRHAEEGAQTPEHRRTALYMAEVFRQLGQTADGASVALGRAVAAVEVQDPVTSA